MTAWMNSRNLTIPVIRMGSFQRAAPVDNHSQKANKKKAPSMLLVYRRRLKNLYEGQVQKGWFPRPRKSERIL